MIIIHVANEYEGAIQRRNAPHDSPSEDCVAKKDSVKAYWSPRPRPLKTQKLAQPAMRLPHRRGAKRPLWRNYFHEYCPHASCTSSLGACDAG